MLKKKLSSKVKIFIEMLAELSPREWDILNFRFNHDKSMYEVAKKYKLTPQRIAMIENRAVKNIGIAFGEIEKNNKKFRDNCNIANINYV